MKDHKQNADQIHELASLYALGALDADEKSAFEAHLDHGCTSCATDVGSFNDVVAAIAESASVAPPAALRKRLLNRLSGAPKSAGILLEQSGLLIARSEEVTWKTMGPGVSYKPLYSDPSRRYHTSLVRMDPGVHYPSHRHTEIEELFLLSGDFHVEGLIMQPGDYCRADSGSIHGETFTDNGCLFLLMASQDNQILETRAT